MRFLRNKEENVSKKVWFFLAYTVCFAIIAGAVFSVFIINKKSFIWVPDGLQQHFNALLYYRSWLLSILDTLVTEHKVSVPLWDMQIGLGSDVLTTLHYYVIGDPLNLLSVFVPDEKYMELFYNTMVLVRIYLAGLAFSAYCRYHGQKPYSTLLGAMVYDFCFWVIIAVRHPYFLNFYITFRNYSSQLFTVLGNGMTSRILPIPVRYMTHLSNPSPNPAWWVEPYFLRSR